MREDIRKNQKGITLAEVLAVLVILGVLATISILTVEKIIENSRKNAVIATARQMVDATRYMWLEHNIEDFAVGGNSGIDGRVTFQMLIDHGFIEPNEAIVLPERPFGTHIDIKHKGNQLIYIPFVYMDYGKKRYAIFEEKDINLLTKNDVRVFPGAADYYK